MSTVSGYSMVPKEARPIFDLQITSGIRETVRKTNVAGVFYDPLGLQAVINGLKTLTGSSPGEGKVFATPIPQNVLTVLDKGEGLPFHGNLISCLYDDKGNPLMLVALKKVGPETVQLMIFDKFDSADGQPEKGKVFEMNVFLDQATGAWLRSDNQMTFIEDVEMDLHALGLMPNIEI